MLKRAPEPECRTARLERMNLFDSHCHLDDPSYSNDLDAVLERARTAGVSHMMTIGVTLQTSRSGVELAKSQPGVYASVGVHPHDSREFSDAVVDELIRLSQDQQVRAWGETGLDFNRMYSPREDQEKCFVRQLEAAAELGLPIIPRDQLLAETDAPYLIPEPERRHIRRNEPAFVRSVLHRLAIVRREDPEELARTVFENTCRLYRIGD